MQLRAALERAQPILRAGISGERRNRHVPHVRIAHLPQAGDELVPVHVGHANIGDDDVRTMVVEKCERDRG